MTLLPLQQAIVYGPIDSRRLGLSLGINLLPQRYKLCSFDCIYCHYGQTDAKTLDPTPGDLPWTTEVVRAVEVGLRDHPAIDCLTFSGNGEPTLHPAFPKIVEGVRALRDRAAPDVRLALFSNATTLHRPAIRQALAQIDAPILKLDGGDEATLQKINRPTSGIDHRSIVEGLSRVPNAIIQSVLIGGARSNVTEGTLQAWMDVLARIGPAAVQVYSTDYPVAQAGIKPVPPYRLREIARRAEREVGQPVRAYWL